MVDQQTFREALGSFATGVTVVTTRVGEDDHGMTVNSFTSVSLDPPLVLFNADKGTNTHDLVASGGNYAVNILTQEQEWLSNRFAGEHHDMDRPFEDVPLRREQTGAPIFENALAYADCSLEESYPGGDHTIYVGRVETLGLENGDAEPLIFYQGDYRSLA